MIETGRRRDRWLEREWWANSQRSRQTTRERKRLPASQGGADRQAGRHHNRSKQVGRQGRKNKKNKMETFLKYKEMMIDLSQIT